MIGDFPARPDWAALHVYEGVTLRRDVTVAELRRLAMGGLVYLATPYSRRAVDERGRWSLDLSITAMSEASVWAWRLTRAGLSVVSPVMMSAQMVHDEYASERPHQNALDPLDGRAWETWCTPMLAAAQLVVIPPIDGWDRSAGIWREAVAALGANKPVFLMGGS